MRAIHFFWIWVIVSILCVFILSGYIVYTATELQKGGNNE